MYEYSKRGLDSRFIRCVPCVVPTSVGTPSSRSGITKQKDGMGGKETTICHWAAWESIGAWRVLQDLGTRGNGNDVQGVCVWRLRRTASLSGLRWIDGNEATFTRSGDLRTRESVAGGVCGGELLI